MLAIICLLGSLCIVLLGIKLLIDVEWFPIGFIVIIPVCVLNVAPIYNHTSDLATIRTGEAFIEIKEEAITRINKELVGYPRGSLMNADSPVRAYINVKSGYINSIANTKTRIQNSRKAIVQRSLGTSAWVVWLIGNK